MNNKSKEIYNLEFKVITPVHIGNGEKIPKTELGFFPDSNFIRKVDFDRFSESLPQNKLGEFSQILGHAKNDFFNQLIRFMAITSDNLTGEYDLKFLYDYTKNDIKKIQNISAHIKTPFFLPYIPGSSLKGWLRTAITYYFLKRIKEAKKHLEELNSRLDNLPREGYKLRKEKGKMGEIIEKPFFGGDPRKDIFRFITLTDCTRFSSENLVLSLMKIFHPEQKQGQFLFSELGFPQFLEVLTINSKTTGKLIISKDIALFKENYLKGDSYSEKITKYILKNTIELNRNECFKKVCEISNIFSKHIMEYNYKYLTTLQEEIKSHNLNSLIKFYDSTLFPLYDEVSNSEDKFLLRIGAGTEWHSKTIGLEIFDYFIKEKKFSFSEIYERINKLKLFRGKWMHEHFGLTPISRSYILNQVNVPQFPLGWVQARLKT